MGFSWASGWPLCCFSQLSRSYILSQVVGLIHCQLVSASATLCLGETKYRASSELVDGCRQGMRCGHELAGGSAVWRCSGALFSAAPRLVTGQGTGPHILNDKLVVFNIEDNVLNGCFSMRSFFVLFPYRSKKRYNDLEKCEFLFV